MKSNILIAMSVIGIIVLMLVSARENDKARQKQVAYLTRTESIGKVAGAGHTTLRFHEFIPPKYPGKKCLFVETGAHRSGITCWDMPGD